MANVVPLFAVPLFVDNIGTDFDLDFLKDDSMYDRMHSNNGYYTKDKKILNNPNLEKLKLAIASAVGEYINFLKISGDIEFFFTTSWVVKHDMGDFGGSHHHANSLFSGVYYFDVHPDSGDIIFENGQENIIGNTLKFEYSEWNIFNSMEWNITPENGMLVMFPSHLSHRINPNQNKLPRYVLAFNLFAKGAFGRDNTGLMELDIA